MKYIYIYIYIVLFVKLSEIFTSTNTIALTSVLPQVLVTFTPSKKKKKRFWSNCYDLRVPAFYTHAEKESLIFFYIIFFNEKKKVTTVSRLASYIFFQVFLSTHV